ncbi:PKS-NRPS hybrid synthetase cheA-like [Rhododendron vialii]|uniref:PKS-NRPS hybrid synthetase cheA-like n=1 Tax=Rhododendron vialii TaxID=182163 RepID=UPI002660510A|nr:PKS-NRPS hybrid synthetase cheA-like [Rhododendron vialii]
METSIASSPSIGKEEVLSPTYESNVHFDWGLEDCAMEMEVDKEEGAIDVAVSEPKSQHEGDTSTFGSHVGPATNPTPTPTIYDYTEHFTTDKVFLSEKELVEWTRSTGKRYGFVIIIKASEKFIKNRKPRMRFSCERSGKYRKFVKKYLGEEVAVKKRATRSTGTKKIECPFLLKGVKGNDGWTVSVHNGTHNHPPAVYLEGHSYPGRLSAEQTATLVDLSVAMVKPKQILSQLKGNDPSNVTTIRHVYNARHKYRVIEKAGRTQMQHLMARLQHFSYVNWDRSNKDGNVTDLFWAPPCAGEMLRAFPRVLMMDCTYKTNRYRFPLLQIVGVTCTELTFNVAFAFIECEKEENYTWVLEKLKGMMDADALSVVIVTDRELALMNAIRSVFPHATNLLCRFHISKNVLAKCRKMFDDKTWEEFSCSWGLVVLSASVTQYEERLRALKRDFQMFPAALDYVEKNWLIPYKERFVGAWTDKVMHFGNLTSNRAESAHAALKHQLEHSQCNFDNIWEKMHRLILLQETEVKASMEKSLTSIPHEFRSPLFEILRGVVSKNGMTHVLAASRQVEWIVESNHVCECALRYTHGLPCAHEIAPCKTKNIPLPLELIHDHPLPPVHPAWPPPGPPPPGFKNYLFKELGWTTEGMPPWWCLLMCSGGGSTMETTEVVREKNGEKGEGK